MGIHINFNDIRRGFEHIPQQIAHVPDEIKRAGLDPHAVQDWIHHEAQSVLQAAGGEVAGIAFHESAAFARGLHEKLSALRESKPDLASAIDEVGISLTLSVVTLTYSGFMGRAEGLCRLLDQQSQGFVFNRSSVRWILENTGPTEISLSISGELFTSALGAGVGLTAPLALAVELVDLALEKAGVPE